MKEKIINVLKSPVLYFTIGVFVLWYVLPIIPIDFCLKNQKTAPIILMILMGLSTILNMFMQFGLVFSLAKLNLNYKKQIGIFIISLLALCLCIVWIEHYLMIHKPQVFPKDTTYFTHLLAIGKNIGSRLISALPQRGFINYFIITLCFSFGSLLSFIVKEKNLLVPVMICCAFIDIWTCTVGFVSKALAKAPEIVGGVSTGVAMVGGKHHGLPNLATIGPGDFIFASLVFAITHRLGLQSKRTFWVMFGLLTVGMLLIVFQVLPFLPALVCVATGTIIANFKEFHLNKQEIISCFVVFFVLTAILVGFKLLK